MSTDRMFERLDWRLVLPFFALGTVSGLLAIGRLSLDVPVANGAFPARGLLFLSSTFIPSGGSVLTTQPAMVDSLKLPYLLAIGGIVLVNHVAMAVATAVGCWRLSTEQWVPPVAVVGRMLIYALAVGVISFGGLTIASAWPVVSIVYALGFLGASVVLFLTPAVLVFEQPTIRRAIRLATTLFTEGPTRIVVLAVAVAYVGYLSTGITTLLGAESMAAYATGAVVSTTVGGTVHVVALGWVYTTITSGRRSEGSTAFGSFAGND